MKSAVVRPDPGTEFFTRERCHILEMSNSSDDEALSIARVRVEPGVTTELHKIIDTAERYVVLSGEGVVEIEGRDAARVEVGDVVLIPPGTGQRITNTGEDDLLFLAICTPRFHAENYLAVD